MGQRRFTDALEHFRRAQALGAHGFEVHFGLGSALLGHRAGSRGDRRAGPRRRAAAPPRRRPAQPRQGGRYETGLVDEAVADFRAALTVNDDFLHRSALATVIPGSPSAMHAECSRRAAPSPSTICPRRASAFPRRSPGPPRWLPLVVLQVGQLDEAGLGPRQPARPHRLRDPPPSPRRRREHARPPDTGRNPATRSSQSAGTATKPPPSGLPPPSSICSSTSTATARSAAYRSGYRPARR